MADTIAKLRANSLTGLNAPQRLEPLGHFGANPGELGAKAYVPSGLPAKSPLVVVLHGCMQTPDRYDHGSGWSALADEQSFALLYPEQHRTNNPTLCFNWFQPGDTKRDSGEVASIRQMIATMVDTYDVDASRIYITGLSAGGAMTAAMLAAYPEVFAGGAIIGGLPAESARSVAEALHQMRAPGTPSAVSFGATTGRKRTMPILSVWHGSNDHTVVPANADAIIEQWRGAHDIRSAASTDIVDGHRRQTWRDAGGRAVIEQYTIGGMGHGIPLAVNGTDALGATGPYMLDAGISSTHHIARFWGLETVRRQRVKIKTSGSKPKAQQKTHLSPTGPQAVIENALRAAGLMR